MSLINQLGNLPLGDHGVAEIQPTVLPLHWTIHVQHIAQPVVRRTSVNQEILLLLDTLLDNFGLLSWLSFLRQNKVTYVS